MTDCTIHFNGAPLSGDADNPLMDFLAKHDINLPNVCYRRALE